MSNARLPAAAPGLPSSRRAVLLGLTALPAVGGIAVAAPAIDPHIAHAEETTVLWRRQKAAQWGWGQRYDSPAARAATATHDALMDSASSGLDLPRPRSIDGLGALALSLALAHEEAFSGQLDFSERCLMELLGAVLDVAGVALPPGFLGMVHQSIDAETEGKA